MLWCMGAGALALPAGIVSAFAATERGKRVELLRGAARVAAAEGKPLLILVAPRTTRDKVLRERNAMLPWALAHWLSCDETAWLLDLGLFVPAVASAENLKAVFDLELGVEEPRLLWIEVLALPERAPASLRVQSIEGEVLSLAEQRERGDGVGFARAARDLAQHLAQAIACRGTSALDELAARARARLDLAQRAELARWVTRGESTSAELLHRATAELRLLLRGLPTLEREARQQELARAIRSSLGQRRIPGSAWGWSTACGIACDDPRTKEEEMMGATACGIPHTHHQAKRFLFLYLPSTS